ncbi:hypothetical protein SIAM614_24527 [Stappia aggregata IAM 12614]|uniref:Uncharacterized protein n=1 Tax=Roseibium aggregatum (strain ATCC 25650 / DSM 13394 / JCM 20685 / NBRC 16684 / NCIMB 2208 / IAM 12614 / B1) TaxID=384765 RepID=A0NNW2_ROSAI|nr:hypothetical protein SIAM614_24527 [Stappia aggregata IAM 12614] [Roseibium aggregatum IAM 12614]
MNVTKGEIARELMEFIGKQIKIDIAIV